MYLIGAITLALLSTFIWRGRQKLTIGQADLSGYPLQVLAPPSIVHGGQFYLTSPFRHDHCVGK